LKENDEVYGYRIVNERGIIEYWRYVDGGFERINDTSRLSDINTNTDYANMLFNEVRVFGYEWDKKPGMVEFFTVAREGDIVKKKGDKIHKRALIKGARCGDSKLNKTFFKEELADIVKNELETEAIQNLDFSGANKKVLCNDIALIWRMKDLRDGGLNRRYFYSREEARLFFLNLIKMY
jgi:hypothetical protein